MDKKQYTEFNTTLTDTYTRIDAVKIGMETAKKILFELIPNLEKDMASDTFILEGFEIVPNNCCKFIFSWYRKRSEFVVTPFKQYKSITFTLGTFELVKISSEHH